jgi:hypothetical protein
MVTYDHGQGYGALRPRRRDCHQCPLLFQLPLDLDSPSQEVYVCHLQAARSPVP